MNHTVIHTDDYMMYGYKDSLYRLLEDLKKINFEYVIVEGIMGARLMRKLQEQGLHTNVSMYVYISAKFDHIIDVYTRERPDKSLASVESAVKGLDTVHESIDSTLQQTVNIKISDFAEQDKVLELIQTHAP